MYLDKHDIKKLKETLQDCDVCEDDLYLIYRDKDGEICLAIGDDEIFRYKEKGDGSS